MKSERRHELEQNALADWLAEVINKIKPYQNTIFGVLILVVATVVAYGWWSRQSSARTSAGWDRFYAACASEAPNPGDFDDLAVQYPGTSVGNWSSAMAGDLHLGAGCRLLFINKANANEELRQAVDHYNTVRQDAREPMLLERAIYGLARALEAQGDLEQAAQRYDEVVTKWPLGTYTGEAERRSADLKRPQTKTWYDRFAKFDPKPSFGDQFPPSGDRPSFDLDSIPDDGSVFEPGAFMDLKEEGADDDAPAEGDDAEPAPPDASDAPVEETAAEPIEPPVEPPAAAEPAEAAAPAESAAPAEAAAPAEETPPAAESTEAEPTTEDPQP